MMGLNPRPQFLLEFAKEGSRHEELVVPKKDVAGGDNMSMTTTTDELPDKINAFIEVFKNCSLILL